jgi:hypothetical protein
MNRIGSGGQYFRSFDLLFSNSRQRGVSFVSLERKIEREDAPGSVFGVLHANSIKIYHLVSMGAILYRLNRMSSKQELLVKLKEFTANLRQIKKLTASGSVRTLPNT